VSDFVGRATTTSYNKDGLAVTTSFGQSQASSGSSATNLSPTSSAPTITNTYDSSDEISSITASNNSGTILGFSYLRSPSGSIASQTNAGALSSSSGSSSTYSYDTLSRVTQMTNSTGSSTGTSSTYAYDASSNLTILPNGASGTYDPAGELTSSVLPSTASSPQRSTTYTYNANGERTNSAASTSGSSTPQVSTSATWNAANELTSYTSPSASMTSAIYDGQGLRTSASFSSTSGITTIEHYLYDQTRSTPSLIMDSANAYVYANSIAPFEQVNLTTGKTTYLITDATGSVRAVMSEEGKIEAIANYDAYGNPSTPGGLGPYTAFGFAGSYQDQTGLIYMINRYYDPSTGQFISVDPLVAATGQPYAYTGGDQINGMDPNGDFTCTGFLSFLPCGTFTDVQNGISGAANAANSWLNNESNTVVCQNIGFQYGPLSTPAGCGPEQQIPQPTFGIAGIRVQDMKDLDPQFLKARGIDPPRHLKRHTWEKRMCPSSRFIEIQKIADFTLDHVIETHVTRSRTINQPMW